MEENKDFEQWQSNSLPSQNLLAIQEHQRLKISSNLHDNITRDLAALKLLSQIFLPAPSQGGQEQQQKVAQWTELLDHCIDSVRELADMLHPPDFIQTDLEQTIAALCYNSEQRTGTAIRFRSTGLSRLCPITDYDIAINVYRVIQKALNNIDQHAAAKMIAIRMVAAGSSILVSIEDSGRGFHLAKVGERLNQTKHFGLLEMAERIRVLHGTFDIDTAPAKGTKILIEIPWKEMYGNGRHNNPHL
ncbi:MAG: ATP-binding protein [Pseudomonadota bacterium]